MAMNTSNSLLLFFLIAFSNQKKVCNADLLYSYGVTSPHYSNQNSLLCQNGEPENCCSNNDETSLLNNWNDRDKNFIKPYYQAVHWLTKGIFQFYEDILLDAKYIHMNPKLDEKCKSDAEYLIKGYLYQDDVIKYLKDLKTLLNYNAHTRKGFYCALCSVRNQKFFDVETKKIIYSNDFCEDLVNNTLNTILERVIRILPIFDKLSNMVDCKKGQAPNDIVSVLLDKLTLEKITDCYAAKQRLVEPNLYIPECINFCSFYSISDVSEVFDGLLGPLEHVFNKIRETYETPSDMVDPKQDYQSNYQFSKIKPVFFDYALNFQDLGKFQPIFDNFGINMSKEADVSLFYYGMEANLEIYKIARILKGAITGVLIFLTLFK